MGLSFSAVGALVVLRLAMGTGWPWLGAVVLTRRVYAECRAMSAKLWQSAPQGATGGPNGGPPGGAQQLYDCGH